MSAFVFAGFSWLFSRITGAQTVLRSSLHNSSTINTPVSNIPLPPVLHKVLDADFLQKFPEVIIIGDVHGCRDELDQLLAQIDSGKNPGDSILKIFVGDLVNKGPNSRGVLQLLMNSSSSLSVRGNHDEVVIREYLNLKSDPNYSLKPGNLWMKELTQQEVDYLISLPYTISIPSLKTIIVHAGLIPGKEPKDINPSDLISMRNIVVETGSDGKQELNATRNDEEGTPWVQMWNGPEHVYFGHDAKRMLQKTPHATGLDTGCVYGKQLTAVFIRGNRKGSFIHVKANNAYQEIKKS